MARQLVLRVGKGDFPTYDTRDELDLRLDRDTASSGLSRYKLRALPLSKNSAIS